MTIARLMQQAAAGSAGAGPEPSGWTDPDLGNASYDSVSFSVSGQEAGDPRVVFGDEGTKMYVIGESSDSLHQYDVSTAWDVSTAAFVRSLNVNAQEPNPQGVFFKPDGSKLYIIGRTDDDISEYSLATSWDISTASYSQGFNVSSQDVTARGLFFKPDGTKVYILGGANDSIFQYSLSTAWDIGTTSYDSISFNYSAQENNAQGVFFGPNGDKIYVIGVTNDTVYEYSLSSAWDVSTASYVGVSFNVSSQETSPVGIFFKDDGSKMYISGAATDTIYQYSTA